MASASEPVVLDTIEAHRTQVILEEALEKLSFLGSITPDVLQHRDELSQFVGAEISRIIQEQRQLEKRYEELIAKRGTLKGLANKTKYKENQNEIQAVSLALRESTRNLCRNLKDNPNISGNLLKIQKERQELAELLTKTVVDLRERGTFEQLARNVADALHRRDKVKELVANESALDREVSGLDEALAREKSEFEKQKEEQTKEIDRLKAKLADMKSTTNTNTRLARATARAATNTIVRMYDVEARERQGAIRALRQEQSVDGVVDDMINGFVGRKKERMKELELDWMVRKDKEIEGRDAALEEQATEHAAQTEVLQRLQQRREQEVADQLAKEAEEQRLKELAALRKEQQKKEAAAAAKIQQMYRLHMAANASKDKGKKKKGKKGKKGKKKK